MKTLFAGLSLSLLFVLGASPASADFTYSFDNITHNNPVNALTGEEQLVMDVINPGGGQALFTFKNLGPEPCIIMEIYFDCPQGALSQGDIMNVPGVRFVPGGEPVVLPGGHTLSPIFVVDFLDSADKDPEKHGNSKIENGIGPNESLDLYLVINSGTFAGMIDDLGSGSLRVGLHVQAFGDGNSESFVNDGVKVPAPGAIVLGAIGLGAVGLVRRRQTV
jgi:hypothetical protein